MCMRVHAHFVTTEVEDYDYCLRDEKKVTEDDVALIKNRS